MRSGRLFSESLGEGAYRVHLKMELTVKSKARGLSGTSPGPGVSGGPRVVGEGRSGPRSRRVDERRVGVPRTGWGAVGGPLSSARPMFSPQPKVILGAVRKSGCDGSLISGRGPGRLGRTPDPSTNISRSGIDVLPLHPRIRTLPRVPHVPVRVVPAPLHVPAPVYVRTEPDGEGPDRVVLTSGPVGLFLSFSLAHRREASTKGNSDHSFL